MLTLKTKEAEQFILVTAMYLVKYARLAHEEKTELFNNGVKAAQKFFKDINTIHAR
ncbi:MAG: hypothetical protein WKF59_19240 [Chitinophagaceae bacterium]